MKYLLILAIASVFYALFMDMWYGLYGLQICLSVWVIIKAWKWANK